VIWLVTLGSRRAIWLASADEETTVALWRGLPLRARSRALVAPRPYVPMVFRVGGPLDSIAASYQHCLVMAASSAVSVPTPVGR
jgi:hypothetical protein